MPIRRQEAGLPRNGPHRRRRCVPFTLPMAKPGSASTISRTADCTVFNFNFLAL
jgi:hypothetical protein